MEVDKVSFYPLLLDILHDLTESHFVAFDLELSGVPSKLTGSGSGNGRGRPTLQERYLETKQAAERYQILQIGLTCVQQDVANKKYLLKPYNFELSPVVNEKGLDIERIFSFQSGAVEFLMGVGFDMSLPFDNGIPYLSRPETRLAREKHAQRQDKSAIADIQIKPTEVDSLAFLERVRSEVRAWLTSRNYDCSEYVNIGPVPADDKTIKNNSEPPQELTRFEKRLVHQLVRAEFPELVTLSKRGFVQIIRFHKEREDKIAADRTRELEERIGRQKGFRWIIEALAGKDISALDLRECSKDPLTGEYIFFDMNEYNANFHRAANILRGNPRVLIGHNCFLDLVYIYRTFVGELPSTVEEFQEKIHRLWPMIADTKYMSTHNCSDINPVSSLDQIASQLSSEPKPVMEVDSDHKKYQGHDVLHEAGYDSFLTAQIAVRLSAKLEGEGSYVDTTATEASVKTDTNGMTEGVNGIKLTETALHAHTIHAANGTAPPAEPDGFMPSVEGARWKRKGDATLSIPDPDDLFEYNPKDLRHHQRDDRVAEGFEGGMPRFVSDFWRTYGNKLRVFGTEEGVCVLGEPAEFIGDEEETSVGQGGVAVS